MGKRHQKGCDGFPWLLPRALPYGLAAYGQVTSQHFWTANPNSHQQRVHAAMLCHQHDAG